MEIINIVKTLHFVNFIWLLVLPAAMMGIDVVTGLIGAWVHNNFQSAIMRSGLAKKAGELLIIVMGILFTYGMGLPPYIMTCVALYIILMEAMSVTENLDKLGAPLPASLKNVINNVGHAVQEDDINELRKTVANLQATVDSLKEKK